MSDWAVFKVDQSEIDRRDKAILWLASVVLEQGRGSASDLYDTLEEHFMLKSKWAYRNLEVGE